MNAVDNLIQTKNGANVKVAWRRDCKVKKSCQDKIEKSTEMVGRLGLKYDNIKKVIDKRETGELPEKNAGLPWGKWHSFPHLITHNDKLYLRVYRSSGEIPAKIQYFKNGKPVELSEIEGVLLSSEKKTSTSDCIVVKCENILWCE